jgi:hypothetical protein
MAGAAGRGWEKRGRRHAWGAAHGRASGRRMRVRMRAARLAAGARTPAAARAPVAPATPRARRCQPAPKRAAAPLRPARRQAARGWPTSPPRPKTLRRRQPGAPAPAAAAAQRGPARTGDERGEPYRHGGLCARGEASSALATTAACLAFVCVAAIAFGVPSSRAAPPGQRSGGRRATHDSTRTGTLLRRGNAGRQAAASAGGAKKRWGAAAVGAPKLGRRRLLRPRARRTARHVCAGLRLAGDAQRPPYREARGGGIRASVERHKRRTQSVARGLYCARCPRLFV